MKDKRNKYQEHARARQEETQLGKTGQLHRRPWNEHRVHGTRQDMRGDRDDVHRHTNERTRNRWSEAGAGQVREGMENHWEEGKTHRGGTERRKTRHTRARFQNKAGSGNNKTKGHDITSPDM